MFSLSSRPILVEELKYRLMNDAAGACATFEGWVRNHNDGRSVLRLEYEAYDAVAHKEGERILAEARQRFALHDAVCVHRTGTLAIGDMAVWVGVTASHRDSAFAACRYIIDEVKLRVPIWKKEYYAEGDSGWVNAESHEQQSGNDSAAESRYYSRQTRLPGVGIEGQAKLKAARVLIVGAGGLGCPAAMYLAPAGVGSLTLCDGDLVDASNLHRQVLFDYGDIGRPKAETAAARLRKMNPFITVHALRKHLTVANARELVADCDVVLDCTDNFEAKFLINDAAVLERKPAVFAGIYQFEGQMQVYVPGQTACLRCVWQNVPEPGCVANCIDAGVLGAVPGVFGALQAVETLKLILGMGEGRTPSQILMLNLLAGTPHRVRFSPNAGCHVCGSSPHITSIEPEHYGAHRALEYDLDISGPEGLGRFRIVDIREQSETAEDPITRVATTLLPLSTIDVDTIVMEPGLSYLFCCARGARSLRLVKELRARGHTNVMSLAGGASALNRLTAGQ